MTITPIHGHNAYGCFVKVIKGALHEKHYDTTPNRPPKVNRDQVCDEGSTTWLNDKLGFHTMTNESDTATAVSIHVYHPPYDETKIMKLNGEVFMGKISYYSKYKILESTKQLSKVSELGV